MNCIQHESQTTLGGIGEDGCGNNMLGALLMDTPDHLMHKEGQKDAGK